MAPIQNLEAARTFAMHATHSCELLVARKEDTEDSVPDFQIGEIPIIDSIPLELKQLVEVSIGNWIEKYRSDRADLVPYSVTNINRDDSPMQYLKSEEFPMYDSIEPLYETNNFQDSSYDPPRPDFQIVRIRNTNGDTLLAFRQYTNRQLINRNKRSLIFFSNERYTLVEQDELFALPNKFDAIFHDGDIYVFSQQNFEDMFDWIEEFEQQSEQVLTNIDQSDVLIHDFDELEERVASDRRKIRKMYEVSEDGIVDDLDMDTAKRIISEFDLQLDIEEDEDGNEGIEIPDGNKVWDVIRLFNNDHLVSPVDEGRFQVYGKDRRA